MSFQDEQKLSASGFLFAEPHSTAALTSGLGRHWPDARGVFLMDDQNCVVHINAEEHVQIIVKGVGGNIQSAFVHLCELHGDLLHSLSQNGIDFMRSDRLGYVVACPSNLGTALRVYVTLQIPLLAEHVDFRQVCSCLHLEAKEELPSGAAVAKGAYVVSNAHTLGNTEVQIVNSVLDGCRQLVELEQMLENDKPLFFMLPGLGEKDYPGFSTKKCPTNMPDLSKHHSIAANVLKNDCALYDKLKDTSTSNGVSFATCIKSCIDNRGHAMIQNIGAVAGDEECYETFCEFFDPIIELWHGIPRKQGHPTDLDHTKVTDAQIDPTGKYVVANRLRSGRSIRGFPLPPSISKSERREAERLLTKALMNMSGELQGSYYPLVSSKSYMPMPNGMSKKDETALHDAGFLFHEPDSLTVLSSGMGRHWPDARGVFKTKCEKIVAWINEEDHVRFVSIDKGGDLKSTFARFCEVEKYLQQSLRVDGHDFMHNNELGYIVADPTNLGTGLRMSVTLRIPLLSMHPAFKEVCKRLRVEARAGLMSDPDECPGACDISNSQRFGKSEVELVNNLIEGCRRIIAFEMGLAGLEDGEALPLEA
jgi:creatine kinase